MRARGLECQRCRGAKVQRCRDAEVQRCRGAEGQRCRGAEMHMLRCSTYAESPGVQRCSGGADVQRSRSLEV